MLREHTLVKERYLLLRILGKGGFSEVWLADDMWTSTQVALKFYASNGELGEEGIQLFIREFALLSDLNHSNLLKPLHYDHYEKMPFLVLTYCEKGSALKLLNRMDEEKAWFFLRDVSEGLHYLHSNKSPIIHQDIKPDNILVDRNGRFVITDFGISTQIRNTLRRSATSMLATGGGTLAYMPPERFGPYPMPIKASDVYSLGATMFEMLTGNVPFGEHGGLLQKNGADIPKIEGNYSPMLKKIVYQCMAKETWKRPTALELSNYAKSVLDGGSIKIGKKKKPQGVNHKKYIAGLVAGLSAIVLIVAFFMANKFNDNFKQNRALSRYNDYIHRGDSLHEIGLDDETDIKHTEVLENYQIALKAVEKIDNLQTEKNQAQGKIDEVKKLILTAYGKFIHRGDSLNNIGRKKETDEFERMYVGALESYQIALRAVEKIDNLHKEKNQALEKIDEMKKLILATYEEFISKEKQLKEYDALPAAEFFSKRANFLKDFVDKEHIINN
jgi:serine/threonine protein kinase